MSASEKPEHHHHLHPSWIQQICPTHLHEEGGGILLVEAFPLVDAVVFEHLARVVLVVVVVVTLLVVLVSLVLSG